MSVRRVAVALGVFVLAWIAATAAGQWLFGSGNVLVWMIAAVAGLATYLALGWWERRAAEGRGLRS